MIEKRSLVLERIQGPVSVGVGWHGSFQFWGFVCFLGDFRSSDTQCLVLSLNKYGHKIIRDNFEGNERELVGIFISCSVPGILLDCTNCSEMTKTQPLPLGPHTLCSTLWVLFYVSVTAYIEFCILPVSNRKHCQEGYETKVQSLAVLAGNQ